MPDVFDDLDRQYELLVRRSPHWATAPSIIDVVPAAPRDILNSLVQVIRDDVPAHQSSDQAVRALAYVGIDQPDALAVLLHALAPRLRTRMRRSTTADHKIDALGDLVFVIFDSITAGEMDHTSRLAHRLVNRAHNRAHKRAGRITPLPCAPESLGALGATKAPDVAELAASRADLVRFAHTVKTAVDSGRLSTRGWNAYRDQRLVRSITGDMPRANNNERNMASRAAHRIRPLANAQLLCHAS